jgi:hypothetical protein
LLTYEKHLLQKYKKKNGRQTDQPLIQGCKKDDLHQFFIHKNFTKFSGWFSSQGREQWLFSGGFKGSIPCIKMPL